MIEWTEDQKQQLLKILNDEFLFLKNGEAIRRSEMSGELQARVLNVDLTKEMFDLWYEVTFLRFLMTDMINQNEHMAKHIDAETFDKCRKQAQLFLKDKFKIDLEYPKESNESQSPMSN